MELQELKEKFIELGGDPEDIQDIQNPDIIQTLIDNKILANKIRNDAESKVYATELANPIPPDERNTLSQDFADFKRVKAMTEDADFNNVYAQNLLIEAENRIRQHFNLKPKAVRYTPDDLKVLLELDGGNVGEACEEFLGSVDKIDKEFYKQQFSEILFMQKSEKEAKEHDLKIKNDIIKQFDSLKSVPKKVVFDKQDKASVPVEYQTWRKDIVAFRHKLRIKMKEFESLEREFGDTPDPQIVDIINKVNNLCEREGIE